MEQGKLEVLKRLKQFRQLLIIYFLGEYISGEVEFDNIEISDVKWMTEEEIKSLDKKDIRGGETIDSILELSNNELIPLDRIKIIKLDN